MQEKWVPVEDYLPECGRYVPVTLKNGALFVGRVELKRGKYMWMFGDEFATDLNVCAWLDVKPYEV